MSIVQKLFFLFFAIDPRVFNEEVLHPGDQFRRFRNIEIWILLEKLAFKHVYCPSVPNQCRFRGGGARARARPPPLSCKTTCPR